MAKPANQNAPFPLVERCVLVLNADFDTGAFLQHFRRKAPFCKKIHGAYSKQLFSPVFLGSSFVSCHRSFRPSNPAHARQTVSTAVSSHPAARRQFTQASAVAPVVYTSSNSRIFSPMKSRVAANAPYMAVSRWFRFRSSWEPLRTRVSPSVSSGRPVISQKARANTSACA